MKRILRITTLLCAAGGAWNLLASEARPTAVPTFECIGLRWSPEKGASNNECSVRYRKSGTEEWAAAMSLWFDPNKHEIEEYENEYRGSIVGLRAGESYEIELSLASGETESVSVTTWDEDFKVARVVELPERMEETLTITDGGDEESGYVVYQPAEGKETVIDGRDSDDVNIRVEADFVIIRGIEMRAAMRHGVELTKVSNVVIEDCDISGWGQDLDDGWGRNFDSAIFHETKDGDEKTLQRIVIQNNRLHHPRANSNSWMQARESRKGSRHPIGPQGISFINAEGEIVVRYNHIYSDFDHMFNDGMGEYHNFSYGGFPARDSDIYGNFVSHCWDDGLELEGANLNVRCWGNVIDWTFGGIATAGTSVGPVYVFRNVYLHSRKGLGTTSDSVKGQFLFKLGGEPRSEMYARGKIYFFHNTAYQPAAWNSEMEGTSGAGSGLKFSTERKVQTNVTSRNNIFWIRSDNGVSVYDRQDTDLNDYDYDLYNGRVSTKFSAETHGIRATPTFGSELRAGVEWTRPLKEGSAGHDAGVVIPNVNDGYEGKAPDMGALETGANFPDYLKKAAGVASEIDD